MRQQIVEIRHGFHSTSPSRILPSQDGLFLHELTHPESTQFDVDSEQSIESYACQFVFIDELHEMR